MVENKITFLYDDHRYGLGVISMNVVQPFLQQVCDKYEDLRDHYEPMSVTPRLIGYHVTANTDKEITPKQITEFGDKNHLDLEKLVSGVYLVKCINVNRRSRKSFDS